MNANGQARTSTARLCILLACFPGRKGAAHSRRALSTAIAAEGGKVVDDVILSVDGKQRARVHDPHRVVAGTLTPALTWGLFGLVASGTVTSVIIWAVVGAICGGAYAYYTEHTLAKSDLQLIGKRLSPDSSAIVSFVETTHAEAMLAFAPKDAATASVAAIGPDLSARVSEPGVHADQPGATALTMLLLRYAGEHTARARTKSMKTPGAHVEAILEVPAHGRVRVLSPTTGVAAMAMSDVVSWGGFGVVFGFLVGLFGNGGTLGVLEEGIVKGLAWAAFGLVAGALYGLWAGRSASSRRVRGLHALLPANTSSALVWIAGEATPALAAQITSSSEHLTLGFRPAGPGAVLQTA